MLEGFLRQEAIATILDELDGVLDSAYYKPKTHNPYLAPDDSEFSALHPRNRQQLTDSATLAYDYIAKDSLLDRIYKMVAVARVHCANSWIRGAAPLCGRTGRRQCIGLSPGNKNGMAF